MIRTTNGPGPACTWVSLHAPFRPTCHFVVPHLYLSSLTWVDRGLQEFLFCMPLLPSAPGCPFWSPRAGSTSFAFGICYHISLSPASSISLFPLPSSLIERYFGFCTPLSSQEFARACCVCVALICLAASLRGNFEPLRLRTRSLTLRVSGETQQRITIQLLAHW